VRVSLTALLSALLGLFPALRLYRSKVALQTMIDVIGVALLAGRSIPDHRRNMSTSSHAMLYGRCRKRGVSLKLGEIVLQLSFCDGVIPAASTIEPLETASEIENESR
jgi:hypothetical protein